MNPLAASNMRGEARRKHGSNASLQGDQTYRRSLKHAGEGEKFVE